MKRVLIAAVAVLSVCSTTAAFAKGGYVKLYEHKGFYGRSVVVGTNRGIPDMHANGMNDTCSSIKYNIPTGWQVVLHADTGYRGSTYVLEGRGSLPSIGYFEDKCSSLEWVRR
jgi:hypothetical protein